MLPTALLPRSLHAPATLIIRSRHAPVTPIGASLCLPRPFIAVRSRAPSNSGRALAEAQEGGASATEVQRLARSLGVRAGGEATVHLQWLAALLASGGGEEALRDLNPLLNESEAYELLSRTAALLLRLSRASHTARALALASRLEAELRAEAGGGGTGEAEVLAEQLAAMLQVHSRSPTQAPQPSVSPTGWLAACGR